MAQFVRRLLCFGGPIMPVAEAVGLIAARVARCGESSAWRSPTPTGGYYSRAMFVGRLRPFAGRSPTPAVDG